jgi:aspartate 1-decarboxylase
VLTGDGFFVAMHDLTLEGTTNVMDYPEYADRIDTFVIEGEAKSGYYAINFTLRCCDTIYRTIVMNLMLV